jgi:Xaa-Pro aminopeptidase
MAEHLFRRRIELFDAQEPLEQARRIKSAEEIACLQIAMDVCDVGVRRIRETLRSGLTENQLWSVLHSTNIAHGGDFIECRLLASGPRTLPWFQECSSRVINAGDIVSFDTDMIGPTGYVADISRAYVCPGRKPTAKQRDLYALAQEQVFHNMALLKPGLAFREFAERGWRVPPTFVGNRYLVLVHGVGLADEYPAVLYDGDQQQSGYDGMFEENMVVSVESYLGAEGGNEGIKLEQQVLITRSGAVPFSKTPFEGALEIS